MRVFVWLTVSRWCEYFARAQIQRTANDNGNKFCISLKIVAVRWNWLKITVWFNSRTDYHLYVCPFVMRHSSVFGHRDGSFHLVNQITLQSHGRYFILFYYSLQMRFALFHVFIPISYTHWFQRIRHLRTVKWTVCCNLLGGTFHFSLIATEHTHTHTLKKNYISGDISALKYFTTVFIECVQ